MALDNQSAGYRRPGQIPVSNRPVDASAVVKQTAMCLADAEQLAEPDAAADKGAFPVSGRI